MPLCDSDDGRFVGWMTALPDSQLRIKVKRWEAFLFVDIWKPVSPSCCGFGCNVVPQLL